MSVRYAVSLVLNVHLPYVRDFPLSVERDLASMETSIYDDMDMTPGSMEESWFFESISQTYIPLLALFDRLEADHVPFRLSLALSPVFIQMLGDEFLQRKYLKYLDHQIDFGKQEIERLSGEPALCRLARMYYDNFVELRAAYVGRYDGNLFKAFDFYQRKRRVEFLAVPATHAFLPFLCSFPEAVQAQMETAVSYYRHSLGVSPQGFWLPEMGWSKELDPFLRSYGFNYTITDSHGFVLGNPRPSRGSFFPVRTPHGIVILSRDFNAGNEIIGMRKEGVYRDNGQDIGYELPLEMLAPFTAQNGARCRTGYNYRSVAAGTTPYNPAAASAAAKEHARSFLENCCGRLDSVKSRMEEMPISLCAFNADVFGRHWYEGPLFLENLFRLAADYRELRFMTPSEYISQQTYSALEVSLPEFSSWGDNGYAEVWLDSSNDWVYRHLSRSIDRMVELADRFTQSSSLKERALNQGAREILLAMSSDWPALLYHQEATDYARRRLEDPLRNFTTIYEALGSNYISTEWLTNLERRHDVFPRINYRVFKRKL